MSLTLYNTFSKKEEQFIPLEPKKVKMYTCGPTVYGRPHVGNYSAFLLADLLRRWLEVSGYEVTHVKNITDVGHLLHDADHGDDKIEREAQRRKLHPLEIAKLYTEQYLEDERTLNILEPAARPRATETVVEMIGMVEALLKGGHAYETDDGIYFSVESFPEYGKLSGNTVANLAAGARVEVKEGKRHSADFALWKKCVKENADHILRWPSPWGEGFPGWHIECSAMSRKFLGDTLDIHTGGEDNIFPHHECEIAQSESVTGKPFVRYWLHRRRIDMGAEKMSKSLNNTLSLQNILERGFDAMDLRYYLLSVHYRTQLAFTWEGLASAKKARGRIVEWMGEVEGWGRKETKEDKESKEAVQAWKQKFSDAMDADLNTPAALAVIFDCMSWSRNQRAWNGEDLAELHRFIADMRHTFGCFEPEKTLDVPARAQALLAEREAARGRGDFAESDRLRDELKSLGFAIQDTSEGPKVRKM